MFRTVEDFEHAWNEESGATLKILAQLTDPSLNQRVTSKGRSLGFLAWHLVLTLGEMSHKAGLSVEAPPEGAPMPKTAKEIIDIYGKAACSLAGEVKRKWRDASLHDEVELYGEKWERRRVLSALILHQAHHRGQMTVLMRQAGLAVPGIYGPSYEEWATMGLPPVQ
ncbi:MAG: DinB family protein [Acidobacteriota bacterium]